MLTGKRFRLTADTIAIESVEGKRHAIMIPSGQLILVLSGPLPDDRRMIDVQWDNRNLAIFADDIQDRGELVNS